jgi:hypothetical protein
MKAVSLTLLPLPSPQGIFLVLVSVKIFYRSAQLSYGVDI